MRQSENENLINVFNTDKPLILPYLLARVQSSSNLPSFYTLLVILWKRLPITRMYAMHRFPDAGREQAVGHHTPQVLLSHTCSPSRHVDANWMAFPPTPQNASTITSTERHRSAMCRAILSGVTENQPSRSSRTPSSNLQNTGPCRVFMLHT